MSSPCHAWSRQPNLRLYSDDPVQAEVAIILAHVAEGDQGRGAVHGKHPERGDGTGGLIASGVYVGDDDRRIPRQGLLDLGRQDHLLHLRSPRVIAPGQGWDLAG